MKRSFMTLGLGLLLSFTVFPKDSYGQLSCPVMQDAYWSLNRAALNLTQTRFGDAAETLAARMLVRASATEISNAMDGADCRRDTTNPLPVFNFGSYKENCPVIESAKNYIIRALNDFPGVRPIFRPMVVHPAALSNEAINLLKILGTHHGCR